MFSLFLFGDIFAVRMRYTRFARAIYCRFASMRYDINPLTPRRAYRLCGKYRVLNISPVARCSKHIANLARDLYHGVFSVEDNTLSWLLFFSAIKPFR